MLNVLGLSASLRNARFGAGSDQLVSELGAIGSSEALTNYLCQQTRIRADLFLNSGRKEGRPFDEIYNALRRAKGDLGLSNSEACLAAALWGALQAGARISHCGLARHFPVDGPARQLEGLKRKLLAADALLLSGPVYFGDRGSVAQEFFEFVREDSEIAEHLCGRVYGGVSVGAKRNGGQETTLIYQLVDATNLGMLAVGNDAETTAQYGGTAVAGDVGTAWKDDYGIKTSIGTGRRVAKVAQAIVSGRGEFLKGQARVAVFVLQDSLDGRGRRCFRELFDQVEGIVPDTRFDLFDVTNEEVLRCIACDICPVDPGVIKDYRCIIKSPRDFFNQRHEELIEYDAIILAAYSPNDRSNVRSVYQRFVERTRYLRRDDYVFGDRLAAPFVISEVNSNQNLHIRMLTSLVRHHTVLHHPLIGIEHHGRILNSDFLVDQGISFARKSAELTAGRIKAGGAGAAEYSYNPLGYEISAEKKVRDDRSPETAKQRARRREESVEKSSRIGAPPR